MARLFCYQKGENSMKELVIISDNTSRRAYKLDDTDSNNILDLAMMYGRGESGEVVYLNEDDKEISRCYWDQQYRKYKKY